MLYKMIICLVSSPIVVIFVCIMESCLRKAVWTGGFLLFLIITLNAQVDFGLKAGVSYSSLTQKVENVYESGARMGFSGAVMADIPLKFIYKRLSFRPEVAFVNQGGSWYSGMDMEGMALYNKCWYNSLNIPLNIAFSFPFYDIMISLYLGPSLDFSLFGHMTSRETDVNLLFGHSEEEDLKSFDLGVNLGLAVEYRRCLFSINSNCGTFDRRALKRTGESRLFQNNVTFSVGYFFRK